MAEKKQQERGYKPVFFIGLGTEGSEIVGRVRERIKHEADDFINQWTDYMAVISEVKKPGSFQGTTYSFAQKDSLTQEVIKDSLDNDFDSELNERNRKWWPQNPDGSLWYPGVERFSEGCSGNRVCGRLLLHRAGLKKQIQAAWANMRTSIAQKQKQNEISVDEIDYNAPIFHLVTLLAGGTGSGLLIDMAILIKSAVPEARIIGTLLLGDACYLHISPTQRRPDKVDRQHQNTVAGLLELYAVHTKAGWNIIKDHYLKQFGSDDVSNAGCFQGQSTPPLDLVRFVGGLQQNNKWLPDFASYKTAVSEYLTLPMIKRETAKREGDYTDELADMRQDLMNNHPWRMNAGYRMGLLHVRLPEERILQSMLSRVAEAVKSRNFKNTDDELFSDAWAQLMVNLNLDSFDDYFTPPVREADKHIYNRENEDLPDKAKEFKNDIEKTWNKLVDIFSHWENSKAKDATDSSEACWKNYYHQVWIAARDQLLQQTLVGVSGNPSLGVLKNTLESLDSTITGKINSYNGELIALNEQAAGVASGGQIYSDFQSELEAQCKDYPGKGVFGMFSGRGSWSGKTILLEKLKDINSILARRAQLKSGLHALQMIQQDIHRLTVIRKAIGKFVGYHVLDGITQSCNAAFDQSRRPEGSTERLVLKSRTEIDYFISTCVSRNGEIETAKNSTSAKVGYILGGGGDDPEQNVLLGDFRIILEEMEKESGLAGFDHHQAFENYTIRSRLIGMRHRMQELFEDQKSQFQELLQTCSVWDALAQLSAPNGEFDEAELFKHFRNYQDASSLFGKLKEVTDKFQALDRSIKLFCDTELAEQTFTKHGIPGQDLSRVVRETSGFEAPQILNIMGNREIIFLVEYGRDNPRFFEGFELVHEALITGNVPDSLRRRFSDRRFPEWIEEFSKRFRESQTS